MRSFSQRILALLAALFAVAAARTARAQQPVQGFALDRLYQSAPGAGWFVMDTLDMHGGFGGAAALTMGYAHDPLRLRSSDGSQRLTVVADEALATFGVAATYERLRFHLDLDMPLDISGDGGVIGGYQLAAPSSAQPFTPSGVNPSTAPDAFGDARFGVDARLLGSHDSAFRLGLGAQLFVPTPNTNRAEYLTDGTFRAMGRVLFAGDIGSFTYAGHLGVHVRPLDDSPTPGSPRGSELLFGVAAGARVPIFNDKSAVLVVGPEVYGASAFQSLFTSTATALEGLLSTRVEGTAESGPQLRGKLGVGAGLNDAFGAPQWRVVFGIELFDHHAAPRNK